jgi:hypothetical protein
VLFDFGGEDTVEDFLGGVGTLEVAVATGV